MSAEAVRAAPAVVRSTSLDFGNRRSFLADVVIDYGPADVLGRMFLQTDSALREMGITMSFVDFDELIATNRANADTWRPIVPLFDPDVSNIDGNNGHALLGRNARGDVVCSHACRLYDLKGNSLKDEIESLRILYADPSASRAAGEAIRVTAPSAATMAGSSVYTGAAWYRPDYRKRGIMPILTLLTRGIWFTRWYPERCFTFMAPELINAGVPAKCLMPNVEWAVELINTPVVRDGTYRGALIWADHAAIMDGLTRSGADASRSGDPQIDGMVGNRPTNQQLAR